MNRKEAIETIRRCMPHVGDNQCEFETAMRELIPELAESEDERILREIKRYIKEQGAKPTGLPNGTVPVADMIAWLEKQKEQKPIEPKFKVGDRIKLSEEPKYPFREIVNIKDGAYYFDEFVHLPFKEQDKWEKEQKPENGTVLKGFVAVDYCDVKTTWNPTGRRVLFFTKKPVRNLLTEIPYWASTGPYYERIKFGYECFPELKWEDEPVEVELLIYGTEQKPINESNMHEPTLDEAKKWNEAYEKGYSLGYKNGRNEQKPVEEHVYPATLDEAIKLYYETYGNGKGSFEWLSYSKFEDICKEFVNDYGKKSVDEKIVDEVGKSVRKKWALDFINYLDANRPKGKMNVSDAECEDIEEAFFSADWEKIYKYYNKYSQIPVEWSELKINGNPIPTENQAVDISLVEWSEEDKGILLSIKCVIDSVWHNFDYDCSKEELKEMWNWLDTLWQRVEYSKPKQEWGEEDEERLDSIIESYKVLLKDYKACHDVDYIPYNSNTVIRNVVDDVNFLKSLRPSWRPSEEQLEAARYVSQFDYGGHKATLVSLYEQLKQLM